MPPVDLEAEWYACNDPWVMTHSAHARINLQRFRWLAVHWGMHIRSIFEANDLPWFDAYETWVSGKGQHPSELALPLAHNSPDRPREVLFYARCSAESIRENNPLRAAAFAALALSYYYPHSQLDRKDLPHRQNTRSKRKREANQAIQQAHWSAERDAAEKNRQHVWNVFCDQFREVAGNPFRPVQIQPDWLTSSVVELARCIHADQAFGDMPILSDALQDAGCDHPEILAHCRGPGPHVRGCWVLSLLMGE